MFLEHVNMTVSDLDRSIAFYEKVLGLRVRWKGSTSTGEPAAHVGDDRCYLALFETRTPGSGEPDYERVGLNHFGWVVDDLDQVKRALSTLNMTPHFEADYAPGQRLYVLDPDGIELELVQYAAQTLRASAR